MRISSRPKTKANIIRQPTICILKSSVWSKRLIADVGFDRGEELRGGRPGRRPRPRRRPRRHPGSPANFRGFVLGGGGGGRPDYLQKLKVPEGYEKINDYSKIRHVTADGLIAKESFTRTMCTATNSAIPTAPIREEWHTRLTTPRSRLYRSQMLQENMRWKALAEIYTFHSFAPFSKLIFYFR